MRKFGILLRKEIKELVTISSLLPVILIMVIFYFMGDFIGDEIQKEVDKLANIKITVCDRDNTLTSRNIIAALASAGCDIEDVSGTTDENVSAYAAEGTDFYMEIPEGFGRDITELGVQTQIKVYSTVKSSSLMSSAGSAGVSAVMETVNAVISNELIAKADPSADPAFLKTPVGTDSYTVFNGRIANVSASDIQSKMMMQTMFLPVVLFLVIMLASQMLANSVANEKTDKTLETLLSAPVGRVSILSAKMLAAGLVSLFYSVFYIVGYSSLMDSMYAPLTSNDAVSGAMASLGLEFSVTVYALFGLQLFLSILAALAVSLIIGILAEDVKRVQGMIMPLTLLIMVPYLISMFTDIMGFNIFAKILVGLIPFTHAFTAVNAVMFGNMTWYWIGAAYQAVFVAALIYAALRIIRSDVIFTFRSRSSRPGKKQLAIR